MKWYCDGAGTDSENKSRWVVVDEKDNKYYNESNERFTNNEAEWKAVCMACEKAADEDVIFSDSLLVVNQANGLYRVCDYRMIKMYSLFKTITKNKRLEVVWIPREKNLAGRELEVVRRGVNYKRKRHKDLISGRMLRTQLIHRYFINIAISNHKYSINQSSLNTLPLNEL